LYYVKQLAKQITETFKKDVLSKIVLSNFLFHFFGNYQLALIHLEETQDLRPGFKEEFSIYRAKNEIE
jgi:hypothetical protein